MLFRISQLFSIRFLARETTMQEQEYAEEPTRSPKAAYP